MAGLDSVLLAIEACKRWGAGGAVKEGFVEKRHGFTGS